MGHSRRLQVNHTNVLFLPISRENFTPPPPFSGFRFYKRGSFPFPTIAFLYYGAIRRMETGLDENPNILIGFENGRRAQNGVEWRDRER
ncbi:hypothetical protein AVEN_127062-1 [Araneus ventricosus]|uniref:Uncharacterized protein n=1 Tax=Araneus ventricosus TaxID=182803 RepID=A0A4Y2I1V0_ARAVE|nr:hypothetical protein AVEN_127062-1 [Araneus ventricosus]